MGMADGGLPGPRHDFNWQQSSADSGLVILQASADMHGLQRHAAWALMNACVEFIRFLTGRCSTF